MPEGSSKRTTRPTISAAGIEVLNATGYQSSRSRQGRRDHVTSVQNQRRTRPQCEIVHGYPSCFVIELAVSGVAVHKNVKPRLDPPRRSPEARLRHRSPGRPSYVRHGRRFFGNCLIPSDHAYGGSSRAPAAARVVVGHGMVGHRLVGEGACPYCGQIPLCGSVLAGRAAYDGVGPLYQLGPRPVEPCRVAVRR